MILLSGPNISGNEWKYVKECLDTEWVSSAGRYVELFEQKIAEYTGSMFAIACVNGTSALQVSLQLAGVELGDEVIVPTLTFIAPINAVVYNGASPVFMDADRYYNIDVEKTMDFINTKTEYRDGFTFNKSTGKRISAVIPVHVWGNAVWLDELIILCKERNIAVLEDACESLGSFYTKGKYKGKHTGTIGKMGCLSFNGNKIITTGGGGMILTNDTIIAEKARYLTTQAKDHPVKYIHNEIGYNFRLTNIQAALGVAQLEQMPYFLKQKKKIYKLYINGLKNIEGIDVSMVPNYANNNHWLNVVQIDKMKYGEDKEKLMNRLKSNGIQTRPVWGLNHLQTPYLKNLNYKIENAEKLLEKSLSLPSSSNLINRDLNVLLELLTN